MTCVDLSEDMLTEADALATEKNLSIQSLKQDMTELSGLTDFDLVISYCDVVNYLTDTDKLKQAFQRIFQSLSPGGAFLLMYMTLIMCNTTWRIRSEEHTSELQSRGHLVCRLLLEKKNKVISRT